MLRRTFLAAALATVLFCGFSGPAKAAPPYLNITNSYWDSATDCVVIEVAWNGYSFDQLMCKDAYRSGVVEFQNVNPNFTAGTADFFFYDDGTWQWGDEFYVSGIRNGRYVTSSGYYAIHP